MFLAVFLAFALLGCASAGHPVEPAPSSAPAAPTTPAVPTTMSTASAPSSTPSGQEPAPLRAGTDGGYSPNNGERAATACTTDTIRRTLEQVVAQCRRAGSSLCGEIKVRSSPDGRSVQVTLDVTKDSFDDSFSRCVTSRLDAVAWRCTLPGSDTTLDLGCEL